MKAISSICFASSSAFRNLPKKKKYKAIMNGCSGQCFICPHLTSIIKASLLANETRGSTSADGQTSPGKLSSSPASEMQRSIFHTSFRQT